MYIVMVVFVQAKAIAEPFAYEEYRKEKIKKKIEEARASRIRLKVCGYRHCREERSWLGSQHVEVWNCTYVMYFNLPPCGNSIHEVPQYVYKIIHNYTSGIHKFIKYTCIFDGHRRVV